MALGKKWEISKEAMEMLLDGKTHAVQCLKTKERVTKDMLEQEGMLSDTKKKTKKAKK